MLVIFSALISVMNRESVDPGLVGLSLTYALTAQLDIFLMTRSVQYMALVVKKSITKGQ
jgi:uncharacterized membrane protein YjgN (DUF898 family)